MRIRIQPYHRASQSARELSTLSGVRRVRLVRTRFRPRPADVIVNWGSSNELFPGARYINEPRRVKVSGNKLLTYKAFSEAGVPGPAWTTDSEEAQDWVENGTIVVVRHQLRSHSGRGIEIIESGEVPDAPLYTKYVPKYDEYRVHVWGGEVLDIQQKRRRSGHEQVNSRIRNAGNGWVYCRGELDCPSVVTDAAVKAVEVLGLDFGAADVGYTRRSDTATVYEVNSAPGLAGSTGARYAARLRDLGGRG